ncbi:type VI secretion system lipoprotein TssJ [Halomonas borealis]|jgi:type VI secretion system protein VasD|uniref:type VI secretion system lipoprotein TssJ n=1 Tax=Halomonas borealis TaxID=2508710 RepID=UPI00109F2503|nr:type VI secretion system lipoprotein TssJ [Halomonas borealis]
MIPRWTGAASLARCLVLGGLLVTLAGCASTFEAADKTYQVLKDPSIPVGYPEDRPSRVDLSMLAAPNINPNVEGKGTPLRFQILQLKDDSMLMSADHFQLQADLEEALGTNYLAHDDFTLLPGQFKFYEPFEVEEDTRYIGIIAFYASPNQAQWKKVVEVDARGRDYHLLVHLLEREAALRKET